VVQSTHAPVPRVTSGAWCRLRCLLNPSTTRCSTRSGNLQKEQRSDIVQQVINLFFKVPQVFSKTWNEVPQTTTPRWLHHASHSV